MTHHGEALVAEFAHDEDLVVGHRAFGVRVVSRTARRFAAVAVAAQVGEDDHVVFGQDGGDVVPHHVGLRVAVQEQDGGACMVAADKGVDPYPSRGKSDSLEQVGQGDGHTPLLPPSRSGLISPQPSLVGRRPRGVGGGRRADFPLARRGLLIVFGSASLMVRLSGAVAVGVVVAAAAGCSSGASSSSSVPASGTASSSSASSSGTSGSSSTPS